MVREKAKALGAIVMVFRGDLGTGFSCQAPIEIQALLPKVLRDMADEIETTLPKIPE
jgi:hypothetical protein